MQPNEVSAQQATTILTSLSSESYREDIVLVKCLTTTENQRIAHLAKGALKNGYVSVVTTATKLGELDIAIHFRKPIWIA